MLSDVPGSLDEFGAQNCFALASLLLAQQERLLVAPTREATIRLMRRLCETGVIVTPWPEAQWPAEPRAETTPLERLHWRYVWQPYLLAELPELLQAQLAKLPTTPHGRELCVLIWRELALAEAQDFFAGQLIKNGFDGEWAADLEFAFREVAGELPIAKWRYCGWAAVRHGASLSQQRCGQISPQSLRESIYAELLKRSRYVTGPTSRGCELPPFWPVPRSAAGQLLAQRMTSLGAAYWSSAPSVAAIGASRQ